MSTIESSISWTPRLAYVVAPSEEIDVSVRRSTRFADSGNARWHALFDSLIEFGKRKPRVDEDEDGLEWPSNQAITCGARLLTALRSQDVSPPDRLIPGGDGGLDLVFRADGLSVRFEIARDGAVDFLRFGETGLIERQSLPPDAF